MLVILLSLLFVLIICVAIGLMVRQKIRLRRREAQIAAADDRDAVDMILCDSLEILFAMGLERKNGSLDAYVDAFDDPVLGNLLKSMVELHRESRFSDHSISPQRRNVFMLFRKLVIEFAEKRGSFMKRLIHRYVRNLY